MTNATASTYRHIARISEINLENGKRNPNSQTRKWTYGPKSFTEDDEANPRIEGRVRRNDCAQVTDGGAAIFLASRDYAEQWAKRRNIDLASVPRILGWGHRSATIMFKDKIADSRDKPHVFPQVRNTIDDAFRRAGIKGCVRYSTPSRRTTASPSPNTWRTDHFRHHRAQARRGRPLKTARLRPAESRRSTRAAD